MPEVAAIRTEDWSMPAKRSLDTRVDASKL